MINVTFISIYLRTNEYEQKYTLSSMRLAAYIMNMQDVTVRIIPIDYNHIEEEIDAVAEQLKDTSIVGLSAYLWTWDRIKKINEKIPDRNHKLVMIGGPEVKSHEISGWFGDEMFVYGEAEQFIEQLCIMLRDKVSFDEIRAMEEIADGTKRDGKFFVNLEKPIDWRNPLYSEEFFEKLQLKEFNKDFIWLDTSRGCMYKCGYCGFRNRMKIGIMDYNAIHEEIVNIGRMESKRTFIVDANMGGNPQTGKFILKEFIKYAPKTKIIGYLRPEFIDSEYLEIIRDSNIEELRLGVQTLNDRVPKWLRNNEIGAVMDKLPMLTDVGATWRAELIVGLPEDNMEHLKETIQKMIDEVRPTYLNAYHLTVLNETELATICNKELETWIQMETDTNRVWDACSYNHEELVDMLQFAFLITALYNQSANEPEYRKKINYEQLKSIVNEHSKKIGTGKIIEYASAVDYWNLHKLGKTYK